MTAQAREIIYIDGKEEQMAEEPLNLYLENKSSNFVFPNTACWRGYYGKWLLENDKLFLIDLQGYIENDAKGIETVNLQYLFPDQTKVFANWYSGIIKVEMGSLIEYVHMGYESVYEKNRFLVFEDGIKVDEYIVNHQTS